MSIIPSEQPHIYALPDPGSDDAKTEAIAFAYRVLEDWSPLLTGTQALVLIYVIKQTVRRGKEWAVISITDISYVMELSRPTVTVAVRKLLETGALRVRRDPLDGRQREFSIDLSCSSVGHLYTATL